ncbi:MAG: lysophospholipase [Parahaliea sp.]
MTSEPSGQAALEETLPSGLFYRHWRCNGPARGVILMVHGMGEHSGRYQGFAEFLVPRGFAVVAPDHVGHGRSPGRRVYVDRFSDYLDPLDSLVDIIRQHYPAVPCFLVGHSMGGLISARYLLDHQQHFAGAALSGPALGLEQPLSRLQLWITSLLSRFFPRAGAMELDASQVSRDPEVVRLYVADPLVNHGKITARLVTELLRNLSEVEQRRGEISLPMLIMHGEGDVMTAPSGSRAFHEGISSTDKTLRIYPELYHEIFNEPERLQVLEELAQWLEARTEPTAARAAVGAVPGWGGVRSSFALCSRCRARR